ncbi:MAG: hypothetical protein V1664_03755 [Candidatus Uhrbacteria bacterium]
MPNQPEPEFDNWKDAYEWQAGQANQSFLALTEDELLEMVKKDKVSDLFFGLWPALAEKGTPQKAGPVIWGYLNTHQSEDYFIINSHASEALFKIIDRPDPNMEILNNLRWRCISDDWGQNSRQQALQELKKLVEEKIKK